jgi:uncharacterized protein
MANKLKILEEYIKNLGSVAVAFSGGVDSTFLLKICHKVLLDKTFAVTAVMPSFSKSEYEESINFCKKHNIKQILIQIDQLSLEEFTKNSTQRCYFCKKLIFSNLLNFAKENHIKYVLEGTNADDLGDFRPGMKAIQELGIKSPLLECNINKAEIRRFSKELGLSTWNKPSFACLASRVPYDEQVTLKKLKMIENAEIFLATFGIEQKRVRFLQNNDISTAKIEVLPQDFSKISENHVIINNELKNIGFDFVCVDLQGFRSGSLNPDTAKNSKSLKKQEN